MDPLRASVADSDFKLDGVGKFDYTTALDRFSVLPRSPHPPYGISHVVLAVGETAFQRDGYILMISCVSFDVCATVVSYCLDT